MDKVTPLKIVSSLIHATISSFHYSRNLVCKSLNIYIEKDTGVYIGSFNRSLVLETNKRSRIDRTAPSPVGAFQKQKSAHRESNQIAQTSVRKAKTCIDE